MKKAHIEAIDYHQAPNVITSDWIEEQIEDTLGRLDIPRGSLENITGIKERRFWEHGIKYYETTTKAAIKVIEKAGIDSQDIECIINTSICRDYIEPSQASLVHGNLNLSPHCFNFDISNACLGFVNGMELIKTMINAGKIKKYGLLVSSEGSIKALENTLRMLKSTNCKMDDYKSNFATLTLGSGAVAMLIANEDIAESQHVINDAVNVANTAEDHNKLCLASLDHSQMYANTHGMMVEGIKLAVKTWAKANQTWPNWNDQYIDRYIPHQTSNRQIEALCNACKLNHDKFHIILEKYGNMASAALPMALIDAAETKTLNAGDQIALMGMGSGLNGTIMSLTW
ncbi:hypothetical protein NEF87_003382 [Candidatus Lokiarchaeum ossiferum]|uniref:3-oxoacyl-ACP synthase III n=1 Tax=Candidatus Lokiarchaeum ossiferum TaxID=2951803 RepID=A0ABY6HW62_9ARCH|nr:hypothetical protein NEF87_003382 [Candidatus Lokiarchaeum sp. B-35]